MNALQILHNILEDKLKTSMSEPIYVAFSFEQAQELYGMIHRIITYDKNMKKDTNND